jgi:hypothetical protein
MGTILSISSHPPFAAEAAYGVGLLLFWPAAFQVLRSVPATRGFPVLPVTADPSSCPFSCLRRIPGRSVLQAPVPIPEGAGISFRSDSGPKPSVFLRPCDSVVERTFPVFFDFLNIRDRSGTGFPSSSLRLS